jgi:thymidylate synthase
VTQTPASYIEASSLDDLLKLSYELLLARGSTIHPSKGEAREVTGVVLELSNSRARLSQSAERGKMISALGELCWYLSGGNSGRFMDYYIKNYSRKNADDPDSEECTVNGGYGPRIFGEPPNQFETVRDILRKKPDSRQAVIQIFLSKDIKEDHKDVPCTCSLQFMIRDGKLQLIVYMRSNDAYLGLPHDVFCFTMLQEIMARYLEIEPGVYKHMVGSFHLYSDDL